MGECRAQSATYNPDEITLRQFCNVGYGRGCCERFPNSAETDAVRLHILGSAGGVTRVKYVFEKDCWPKEHGSFDWSAAGSELSGDSSDLILRRQVTVFLENYERRAGK